jgi:hypothetical protein
VFIFLRNPHLFHSGFPFTISLHLCQYLLFILFFL